MNNGRSNENKTQNFNNIDPSANYVVQTGRLNDLVESLRILLDTGSSKSFMSKNLLECCKHDVVKIDPIELSLADKTKVLWDSKCIMQIKINDNPIKFVETVYVGA